MQLSKDVDTLRVCWPDNHPQPNLSQASGHVQNQNKLLSQSNQHSDNLMRDMTQLKEDNEALANERRSLLQLVEDLESRAVAEQKLSDEKIAELEDVRVRVTRVAELFERKEIKSKYSFEVLCDFVFDKAKRLFNKYESVSKERNVMKEEKNYYYDRKVEELEKTNNELTDRAHAATKISQDLIPLINDLLEHPKVMELTSDPAADLRFASQVLEAIEAEHRNLKKNYNLQVGRCTELNQILDAKGTLQHVPSSQFPLGGGCNIRKENDNSYHMDTSLLDYRLKMAKAQE